MKMNSMTRLQFAKMAGGDPTTAGIIGALAGPLGAGVYSGISNDSAGSGFRTGGRSMLDSLGGGVGGSGLGLLLSLLSRGRINPKMTTSWGGRLGMMAGSAAGAATSVGNINRERPGLIGQALKHLLHKSSVARLQFAKMAGGDPTTAGWLSTLLGPVVGGVYSGLENHGIKPGLRTAGRSGLESLGGAAAGGVGGGVTGVGLGLLLSLLSRGRIRPPNAVSIGATTGGILGALSGDAAGAYHGAAKSVENINAERLSTPERWLSSLFNKHSSAEYPMDKAAAVADQFEKSCVIKNENGAFALYTHDGKRLLGRHPTKAKAVAQEQAIKAHGG